MALIIIACGMLASLFGDKAKRLTFVIALSGVVYAFCMMNVNKQIESDWLWYTEHYLLTDNLTLIEYLNSKIGVIKIKPNEPFYYLIARTVYQVSDGSIPALAITITVLNYFLVGTSIFLIFSKFSSDIGTYSPPVLIVAGTIFAITFTLVAHLVRQEISTSIAALGFALLFTGRTYIALAVAVLALATHQSAFLFVWVFFVPQFLERLFGSADKYGFLRGSALLLTVCLSALAGYLIANSEIASLGAKDDGSVSVAIFVLDMVIAGLVIVSTILLPANSLRRTVSESYVLFYAAFAALSVIPLAALRLYFYMDFLRGVSIVLIIISFTPRRYAKYLQFPIGAVALVMALLYTDARVESSSFRYQGTLGSYLTAMAPL